MENIFDTVVSITRAHNEKILTDFTLSDVTETLDEILSSNDCVICSNTRAQLEKLQAKIVNIIINRKAA